MKNKLITAAILLSLLSPVAIAQASASDTPVLAILDTAIDTSLPQFKDKIVAEVCIVEWAVCPNGNTFQEGPGAASMPSNIINLNGFDHGTIMTDIAIKNNPNLKVVFIKIVGNTSTGVRKPSGESSISAALFWVRENAAKYNIKAVSISQGTHALGKAGTDYCPRYTRTITAVDSLMTMGIPVFAASGNNRDYQRIDWPSCIPQVVSVGAVDQINEMATYSNTDPLLIDFFALGNMQATGPGNVLKNIAGTSASTQVAAAQYIKASINFGMSGQSLIEKLALQAKSTVGRQGTFKKLLDINSSVVVDNKAAQAAADAAAKALSDKAAADAKALADKAAADAAAKAKLKIDVDSAIAAAEAQYQIEIKSAQDKLAAVKAQWLAKLNG
jgi:hypothetical protein